LLVVTVLLLHTENVQYTEIADSDDTEASTSFIAKLIFFH